MQGVALSHPYILEEYFQKEHGITDLKETFALYPTSIRNFDLNFTCKVHGYSSPEEYYQKASCVHRIPNIQVPTLFINSLDDKL